MHATLDALTNDESSEGLVTASEIQTERSNQISIADIYDQHLIYIHTHTHTYMLSDYLISPIYIHINPLYTYT